MIIQETPTLNLQFDKAKNDSDMLSLLKSQGGTFTRDTEVVGSGDSVASYFDALGTLRYAKLGHPRPNFVDKVNQGLLIEEERTNLLERSEEFDNAYWNLNNTTVTPNATLAPDGENTADTITVTSGGATTATVFRSSVSITVGQTINLSVFAKAGTHDIIRLAHESSSTASSWFNLTTGQILTTRAGVTASIKHCGGGWYRCSISIVATTNSTFPYLIGLSSADAQTSPSATGTTVFLWGAQLEIGSFPTSYIPTAGETVTRGADNASITGTAFTDFYNQNEGTFIVDFKINTLSSTVGILDFGANANNSIDTRLQSSSFRYLGNTSTAQWNLATAYNPNQNKLAGTYKTGNASLFFNGAKISEDTSLVIPTVANILEIGRIDANSNFRMSGTIKRIIYYPKALPDADLQLLTRI